MKKLYIVFIALTLTLAMPMKAERVSPDAARQAASTFLNNNGRSAVTLNDVSRQAGFANLYIFTTDNSFVILAADDCVQPILGYSLTGSFDPSDMPDNVRWWLQQYNDEIQHDINHKMAAAPEIAQQWSDLAAGKPNAAKSEVVVDPLIATSWNQGSPYNMYCPSGTVTGCVATAMAQVMKYWNYPEQGQGSHTNVNDTTQTVNFGETVYDWDNMTNTYSSSSTTIQKAAVATLMYHCGVSVDMNYGPSSGAVSSKVPSSLVEFFRYAPSATFKSKDGYTVEQWVAMLKSELDESRPVFYAGNYMDNSGNMGGHAFVCDGYDSDNYFHFNWGWGGYKDGYFLIGALNPNPSSGNAIGSGSGTYNLSNGAAFYVEPISDVTAPTITATAVTNTIVLSWNAIAEAVSYDVYRDNAMIATGVTENGFTDDDIVSGVYYEYYVRAVSVTTRSNPSNTVVKSAFFRDYTPSDLTISVSNDDATLTWTAPENNTGTLQYATGYSGGRYGMGAGNDTYWTEVFAPSRLADFVGMNIEKVSAYLQLDGNYTLSIFSDNTNSDSNMLFEQSFTVTSSGWYDIILPTPIPLDCTKDLWIVMYYPYTEGSASTYAYPATYGEYTEIAYDDEGNEERFNPRLIGTSLSQWRYVGNNISWLFRTYLTDGTYTYNLYRNGEVLASQIADTQYADNDLEDGTYTYHVTTNYYGGETEASNAVSVQKTGLVADMNWWTPTVDVTLEQLEAALGANATLINSQSNGFAERNGDTWSGTLTGIQPGQMYKIQANTAVTLVMTGTPLTAAEVNIQTGGYTWFSIVCTAATPIGEALGGFTPANGDTIETKDSVIATYNGGWGEATLQPGVGYVYHSVGN